MRGDILAEDAVVFTICLGEPIFLSLWLAYYSRYFPHEAIHVLYHNPDGRGLHPRHCGGNVTVIPTPSPTVFNHSWLRHTVGHYQKFLLQSHAWTLFAEVDELVAADPARHPGGLGEYINTRTELTLTARCQGYDVVHDIWGGPERPPEGRCGPPYGRDLLHDRRSWVPSPLYCKPLLSRVSLNYDNGFHDADGARKVPVDPDLALVHLHRLDFDLARERHRRVAMLRWPEHDRDAGLGVQNRIVDEAELRQWWATTAGAPNPPLEPIPERFHALFRR